MSIVTLWFEDRFRTLVTAWEKHHQMRLRGAEIQDLAASRHRLDTARRAITELRMAFAPEPNEQQLARGTAYCDTLEIVVYLYDLIDTAEDLYRCVCGAAVRRETSAGTAG